MKKLFISCPMKGRTEEDIRKSIHRMHKMAEAAFDQELEVIPSYIEDKPPENAKQGSGILASRFSLCPKPIISSASHGKQTLLDVMLKLIPHFIMVFRVV